MTAGFVCSGLPTIRGVGLPTNSKEYFLTFSLHKQSVGKLFPCALDLCLFQLLIFFSLFFSVEFTKFNSGQLVCEVWWRLIIATAGLLWDVPVSVLYNVHPCKTKSAFIPQDTTFKMNDPILKKKGWVFRFLMRKTHTSSIYLQQQWNIYISVYNNKIQTSTS